MKFSDLKVEYIKTLMATQRILLTRFGYAVSFMGDQDSLTSGDGINTFDVRVYKHSLDLNKDEDYFAKEMPSGAIDFKKQLFRLKSVPLEEINNFFDTFIL